MTQEGRASPWRCSRSLPTQGCPGACHMQNRFPPTSGHLLSRDLSQPRATHPTAGATGFPIFNKNPGPLLQPEDLSLSVSKKLRMRKPKWFAGEPEKGSGMETRPGEAETGLGKQV